MSGLKAKRASKQLDQFREFIDRHVVHPINMAILEKASDLYPHSVQQGMNIGPSDLIIAATDLEHNLALNTNNQKHFRHFPDLKLVNWSR